MKSATQKLLELVSGWKGSFTGAYSIRENGRCAQIQSTGHIQITPKKNLPGLDIHISSQCQGETLLIPACVTEDGLDDLAYNDFYVEAGAQATIVAGCGVHTGDGEGARHSGVHRFFLGPHAQVKYLEKHVGAGGKAGRSIDPVTVIELQEGARLEMDTAQLGGIDKARRETKAVLGPGSRLSVKERLLTQGAEEAQSRFQVQLDGVGSGVDVVSRSVASGHSRQAYRSQITGNAPCTGHSACDAIVSGCGRVEALPALAANHPDAALIHEAAIGKIAGEQIVKLCTFGLTEQEAEEEIIRGFLS